MPRSGATEPGAPGATIREPAGGLYARLGDSGASFKTSPAVERCLAEWIVGGKPVTADLHPFRASRFAEGRPWHDGDHDGRQRLTSPADGTAAP